MNLYRKISKKPHYFKRITGLTLKEIQEILKKLRITWREKERKKTKRGRPHALKTLENHLLCLLIYYRTYTTQLFVSLFFHVDVATICRSIKKLEPLLAKIVTIKKERKLAEKELSDIIIDCTEQPIERPKKKQKKYYSGKNKKHTLKNEIQINGQGRIIGISKSYPGSLHDFNLRKKQKPLPKQSTVIADSGYQGLQKIHQKAEIYKKRTRGKPLDPIDKIYNKALSSIRISVEHKINELKIFRILKDTFRNPLSSHNIKYSIIAGLVNLKKGFA